MNNGPPKRTYLEGVDGDDSKDAAFQVFFGCAKSSRLTEKEGEYAEYETERKRGEGDRERKGRNGEEKGREVKEKTRERERGKVEQRPCKSLDRVSM